MFRYELELRNKRKFTVLFQFWILIQFFKFFSTLISWIINQTHFFFNTVFQQYCEFLLNIIFHLWYCLITFCSSPVFWTVTIYNIYQFRFLICMYEFIIIIDVIEYCNMQSYSLSMFEITWRNKQQQSFGTKQAISTVVLVELLAIFSLLKMIKMIPYP